MVHVNWYRQLGLAVALFVLGTAAYWLEFKHKPEKETSDEQSKHVFQLKDTSVQAIRLANFSKTYLFSCSDFAAKLCKSGDNSKWEVSEPSKVKADDSNVNSLLSSLTSLASNETIELKEETPAKKAALLKEYGLDPASIKTSKRVHISTAAGETVLYLGLTHPIGESIFALEEHVAVGQKPTGTVDQNRVFLIPNHFKSNLDHDFTYWRDKKIFALGAHEIDSFQLDGPKGKLSAERKDGQWILHSKNDELAGDSENIDTFLSAVTFLSAKGFASDDKNDAKAKAALKGFAQVLNLSVQKEKGNAKEAPAPLTFTLFQKKPVPAAGSKLFAKASHLDPLFELDAGVKNRLDKGVQDLRLTKLITSVDRFTAKQLEFAGTPLGPTPVAMTQADGKWVITADKKDVPGEKISSLLDLLSGNKIKEFYEGSAIPAGEKDGLKISLGDEKGIKRQLVFWKKDNKLYGRDLLSKKKDAFRVDDSLKEALPWDRKFFKAAEPQQGPKADVPPPVSSSKK